MTLTHLQDGQDGLAVGRCISQALVDVVASLAIRPRFLIAKGGITSNDIATKSLNVSRALVLGTQAPQAK
jgi:uncharacterized protein YgbK (DUF1537 family)